MSLRRLLKITGKLISFATPLLALLAMGISISLAGILTDPWLKGVAYVLVWGSLLCLFQVVSREDVYWIKGLIKRKGSPL